MAQIIPMTFGQSALDFVTYTDLPKRAAQDPMIREVVRSRAMRSGHAARKEKPKKSPSKEAAKNRIEDRIGRFRITPNVKQKRVKPSKRPAEKDSQSITRVILIERQPIGDDGSIIAQNLPQLDPFVTGLGGHAWELLHHYRYHFRNSSKAIYPKKEWFSFVISSAATVHATLTLVSLDRDLARGGSASITTTYHRTAAIRHARELLVSERAEDLEVLAGTVAVLISAESLEGNLESAIMHMEGLRSIVAQAGGMQAFSKNRPLIQWMHWSLITYSLIWRLPTGLPEAFGAGTDDENKCDCTTESRPCTWKPVRQACEKGLDPAVLEVLDLLHSLPRTPPSDDADYAESQRNSRLLYTIERNLLCIGQRSFEEQYAHSELAYYTARVYTARALRDLPGGSCFVQSLEEQLILALRQIRSPSLLRAMSEERLTLSLWASLMSQQTLGYETCSDCDPWQLYIRWMLDKLKIVSFESLLAMLRKIAWVDGFMEADLKKLFA